MAIQLRLDLPALERLIGGDSEAEIVIQKQIVLEFAKRHLVTLVTEDAMKAGMAEARKLVEDAVKAHFDVGNLALNSAWPAIRSQIRSAVQDEVKALVYDAVRDALKEIIKDQEKYWSVDVAKSVRHRMDQAIAAEIKAGVRAKLDEIKKAVE